MSATTVQLILIVCIIVVLAVDILNIRKNSQLQEKINMCAELHKQLLSIIIEQEDVITAELDSLSDELWNNKVDKLIVQIGDMNKNDQVTLHSYYEEILSAYREWQAETSAKIKHIKKKQANMTAKMRDILEINHTNGE